MNDLKKAWRRESSSKYYMLSSQENCLLNILHALVPDISTTLISKYILPGYPKSAAHEAEVVGSQWLVWFGGDGWEEAMLIKILCNN